MLCGSEDGQIRKDSWTPSVHLYCGAAVQDEPPGDSNCEKGGASFFLWDPEELSVTVYWQDGHKTANVVPAYKTVFPNGPDCEPECRYGSATIVLP